MTRVIHTGDTHLGYRQYHSSERRQDFADAFEQVVADAIEADVDAVVHAGDLFHDTRPDLPELMETIATLRDLAAADIPFLGIVGNHEGTRGREWLDLFTDLHLAERLDAGGVEIGDVTFYGMDYVPPAQRDRLSYAFDRPGTTYATLVAHGLFEPFAHADWDTEALLDRSTVDFDVLLLGDNHTPGRAEVANTWVTYCGSTERTSAAEREERGYNVVTFDEDVRITRRTVSGTRPFAFVDVTLSGDEGTQRVIDQVRSHEITDAVVVVRIDGTGGDVTPATVEEAITAAGALIVRVLDDRDRPDEAATPVRFADPDRAVEERVRSLGLTPAGRMVDSIVRDRDIADSNVRGRVRSRIETLLEEELGAFESGEPIKPDEVDVEAERTTETTPESDESTVEDTDPSVADQRSIGEFQ